MVFKTFNNTHSSRQLYRALSALPVWNANQLYNTDIDRNLEFEVKDGDALIWNEANKQWEATGATGSTATGVSGALTSVTFPIGDGTLGSSTFHVIQFNNYFSISYDFALSAVDTKLTKSLGMVAKFPPPVPTLVSGGGYNGSINAQFFGAGAQRDIFSVIGQATFGGIIIQVNLDADFVAGTGIVQGIFTIIQ